MKKIIYILLAPCLGLAGCSTINATQATVAGLQAVQALTVTDAYVAQAVSQYIAQEDADNTVAPSNSQYAVRLARITKPFAGEGLNFKVYMKDEINAFCAADGSVRVYSGLMDVMNDEELLGVIGHEIGHYINHDTRDAFRNALLTSAVRQGLASTGGVVGALSASELGAVGQALSQSQYSQKQEREADEYGYNFLKKNGVNPWAMAMAFEKMLQLEQQSGSYSSGSLEQLFSTHPDLAKRAQTMAQQATRDGYSRPSGTISSGTNITSTNTGTSNNWSF